MCFLQPCLNAEFFYFGLRFCHIKTTIGVHSKTFTLSSFRDIDKGCHRIEKIIQDDVRDMNYNAVGGKTAYKANGTFNKLDQLVKKHIFIYNHTAHATCSATKLSQLNGCDTFFPRSGDEDVTHACNEDHRHHTLMPFFLCNKGLLLHYEYKNDSVLSGEVEQLVKIVRRGETCFNTPYSAPSTSANNWSKNDWTRRLVPGIQKLFPRTNPTYTGEMSMTWHTMLVDQRLGTKLSCAKNFLFAGSPDIVITKKIAVSSGAHEAVHEAVASLDEESCSSGDDSLIENSRQPNPMQGSDGVGPPEKIGEVFGSLYVLLVSKILRYIEKEKAVHKTFKVKGLLLSKEPGTTVCILSVDLKEGISTLDFQATTSLTVLAPETLCQLLHNLI